MLDNLKPAWRMYKCQQSIESLPAADILAMVEFEQQQHATFLFRKWSIGAFLLLFLMTCCHGG